MLNYLITIPGLQVLCNQVFPHWARNKSELAETNVRRKMVRLRDRRVETPDDTFIYSCRQVLPQGSGTSPNGHKTYVRRKMPLFPDRRVETPDDTFIYSCHQVFFFATGGGGKTANNEKICIATCLKITYNATLHFPLIRKIPRNTA